jgi:hypothetical protein
MLLLSDAMKTYHMPDIGCARAVWWAESTSDCAILSGLIASGLIVTASVVFTLFLVSSH